MPFTARREYRTFARWRTRPRSSSFGIPALRNRRGPSSSVRRCRHRTGRNKPLPHRMMPVLPRAMRGSFWRKDVDSASARSISRLCYRRLINCFLLEDRCPLPDQMSFVLAVSWRGLVLAKRDRDRANKNEISILVFSVTTSCAGISRRKALKNRARSPTCPPDEKDDCALKEALDLLRGTITDAAFPPNPKAAVR
jgi:hypothetical protein